MNKINDIIDLYAIGNLSSKESTEFEKRLAVDPVLREELAFRRKLINGLAAAHRDDLKKKFSAYAEQENLYQKKGKGQISTEVKIISFSQRVKFALAIAALIIICFGIWYLTTSTGAEPSLPIVEQPLPEKNTEEPVVDLKEPTIEKEEPAPIPSQPKPKVEDLIVKADPARFVTNHSMEDLISGTRAIPGFSFDTISPHNDQDFRLSNKGEAVIEFHGEASVENDIEKVDLLVKVTDNVETNTPFIDLPVELKNTAPGKMGFKVNQRTMLQPGLYYFSIELAEDGTVLHNGKFTVGRDKLQSK